LSARFSFSDFPGFLALGFLGDLSAMWKALRSDVKTLGRHQCWDRRPVHRRAQNGNRPSGLPSHLDCQSASA
jgi:hypothetical protein